MRNDPIRILRQRIERANLTKVAAELGVSPGRLHDLINGRRSPDDELLAKLGLRRVVRYERIPAAELAAPQSSAGPQPESAG